MSVAIYQMNSFTRNIQYYKFCLYGFLKNFRFFDAFFILFLVEKGLPYTQIGILYAIREIFIYVFEIPSGIIADTYGRKNSLLGSFIAYIISFSIFFISNDFLLFMTAFIFFGIGDAFRTGTHKAMIMDYLKLNQWEDQKIDYYGHTRSWSQVGSAISALIAGIIVFNTGTYKYVFLFSIVPYVLNLLLIVSYPQDFNRLTVQIDSKKSTGIAFVLKSYIKVIKQYKVLKIINNSAMHSAYLKAVKDYIQPLMLNVAMVIPVMLTIEKDKKAGLIIGGFYFIIYLITSRASRFSSKVVVKWKHNISYLSLVLGFILGILSGIFFYYGFWIISLIAFVGIYVIENIRKPILTGFIADNVPNEILTSVISTQSLLNAFITAILAIVFGVFADNFGIGISFISVSSFLLFSAILINIFETR